MWTWILAQETKTDRRAPGILSYLHQQLVSRFSPQSLPCWQVPSWSNSPQTRAGKGYSLLLSHSPSLSFLNSLSDSCITMRRAACECVSARMCVCVCACTTPKILEFLSPALKSKCGWAPSLSLSLFFFLSLFTLFLFPLSPVRAERRGRRSGGGTEDRSCFQLNSFFLYLLFLPLFIFLCPFCLTFTLCLLGCPLWQILFRCLARRESKALSVSHTYTHSHTLLFHSTPLPLPQSRGKITPTHVTPSHSDFFWL